DVAVASTKTLEICSDSSHILQIQDVTLNPDPPQKGKTLNIKASGTFSEAVVAGSYAEVEVKYGIIRLIKKQFDLCKEITQANLTCPIGPGELTLERNIDLPKEIPPGTYIVKAEVYTKDRRPITCLKAKVSFRF
ncbi:MD-2-related lipid-recognition domain-containing protein, partial [Syncephalis pseudoplumigaleata]